MLLDQFLLIGRTFLIIRLVNIAMGSGLDIVIGVAGRTLKNGTENLLKIIGEVKIIFNNRLDESEVKLMAHFVNKNVLRCLSLRMSHYKCFLQFYWAKDYSHIKSFIKI